MLAAYLLSLAACQESMPGTEVLVVIDSNLDVGTQLTAIQLSLFDRDGTEELRAQELSLSQQPGDVARHTLPLSLSLTAAKQSSTRDFRVVVTGRGPLGPGGEMADVVEQQAIVGFRPNTRQRLDVFLGATCLQRLCRENPDSTCNVLSGGCEDVPEHAVLPVAIDDGLSQFTPPQIIAQGTTMADSDSGVGVGDAAAGRRPGGGDAGAGGQSQGGEVIDSGQDVGNQPWDASTGMVLDAGMRGDTAVAPVEDAGATPAEEDAAACDDPDQNACGGCSALSEAPGGSCGQCGVYECSGSDSTVCNDPGTNACGGCGTLSAEPGASCDGCGTWVCGGLDQVTCDASACTWCDSQSRPSGVAASDYQCLDFDSSASLPGGPWTVETAVDGQLSVSTTRSLSSPRSMRSGVTASSSGSDRGQLTWTAAGGNAITSVAVAARVNPNEQAVFAEQPNRRVDLLCIENSARSFCVSQVNYSFYSGIVIAEQRFQPGITIALCAPTSELQLPANNWSTLELSVSTSGVASLVVNGEALVDDAAACELNLTAESTATIVVGNHSRDGTASGLTAWFDNVTAVVRR